MILQKGSLRNTQSTRKKNSGVWITNLTNLHESNKQRPLAVEDLLCSLRFLFVKFSFSIFFIGGHGAGCRRQECPRHVSL